MAGLFFAVVAFIARHNAFFKQNGGFFGFPRIRPASLRQRQATARARDIWHAIQTVKQPALFLRFQVGNFRLGALVGQLGGVYFQQGVASVHPLVMQKMLFRHHTIKSPSSEIAEICSKELPKRGGVFMQMEDEIASMAAIVGASASGARALTATSGPDFR